MTFLTLAHMCSHMQNASRAKLGITSVPSSKYNLRLAVAMHRQGLLSTVTRGGPRPPDPATMLTASPPLVTHSTVAKQRLWLGLKYWDGRPVLRSSAAISLPTRSIRMQLRALRKLAVGMDVGMVEGLKLGEVMFVSTDLGVLEIREAIEARRGGMLMARMS